MLLSEKWSLNGFPNISTLKLQKSLKQKQNDVQIVPKDPILLWVTRCMAAMFICPQTLGHVRWEQRGRNTEDFLQANKHAINLKITPALRNDDSTSRLISVPCDQMTANPIADGRCTCSHLEG